MKRVSALALGAAGVLALGSVAGAQNEGPSPREENPNSQQGQPQGQQPSDPSRAEDERTQDQPVLDQRAQDREGADAAGLDRLAEEHPNLSTFARALREAGLAQTVVQEGEFTAFAPTNEAFESGSVQVDELVQAGNQPALAALLRDHLVVGSIDVNTAENLGAALTVSGKTLQISGSGETLRIGGAQVLDQNLKAGNLTIHIVDRVLQPQPGSQEPGAAPQEGRGDPSGENQPNQQNPQQMQPDQQQRNPATERE